MLSPLEAAKRTGKSKTAILKAIGRGRVSARKNEDGEWEIDPSELFRVYPPKNEKGEDNSSGVDKVLEAKLEAAQQQIEALKERVSALEADKEDLKRDRDHWRQQATALLTDQRSGIWQRLFPKVG